MRIVSLLPAATEILYAIGAGDAIVGVTHECDFPPAAAAKPALIRPRVDPNAAPAEVDRQVRQFVERGESIYAIDAELLEQLAPDLIVTQDLCHVCAASPEDLATALSRLPQSRQPQVVTFTPHTLAGVWQGIREIGLAAACATEAEVLATSLEEQVARIASKTASIESRPRVLCLEWFDPLFVGGHWVPEMVRLAGGLDLFGREGEHSFTILWDDVITSQPEIVILMSCGYGSQRNLDSWRHTTVPDAWSHIPAAETGSIYAIDANAYSSRSGPRLAQGVALLANLFHPGIIGQPKGLPVDACREYRPAHTQRAGN